MVEPEKQRMTKWRRVACWIIKATHAHTHARTGTNPRAHTHTEKYVIFLFHDYSVYTNAPQCYVTRTLRLLFQINTTNPHCPF